MDWLEMLYKIFEVCVIPLLGVLTTYLVKYVKAKAEEISKNKDNALLEKYVNMLSDTISECVIATNQIYVDSLKQQGKFDLDAQKAAFELTYNSVLEILSDDAKIYLDNVYGDLRTYIVKKIEAEVNINKQ